jgi:hypothetical protein
MKLSIEEKNHTHQSDVVHLNYCSNILRLTVQCGNPVGSSHLIFVNGLNLINFTVPAATATFIPDQFQVTPVANLSKFYSVEFRSVMQLFRGQKSSCLLLILRYLRAAVAAGHASS